MTRKKWTEEKIIEYVENESDYSYIRMLKDYGLNSRIELKCPHCNRPYYTYFKNFKNGKRCSCTRIISESYIKDFVEKEGYKFLYFIEFKNSKSRIYIECPNGHKYEVTFNPFKLGCRCKRCLGDSLMYDYEFVKSTIESFGYKLISKTYKGVKCKLNIECPNGHLFHSTLDSFRNGRKCPICDRTKSCGEDKIVETLEKYNLLFEREYIIKECQFYTNLPFDFYLVEYNILIEFDGVQHYKPIDFGGKGYEYALNSFIDTKIRDTIKNIYCRDNNIRLIRIPYWDFDNIEKILCKELNIKLRRKGNKQLK